MIDYPDTAATTNETEENIEKQELVLRKPTSKDSPKRNRSGAGVATIVNSEKNGKRISFPKTVIESLNISSQIYVSFSADGIVICNTASDKFEPFTLKYSGNKGIVYSYPLVKEITDTFGLDFIDKVCITFCDIRYFEEDGINYAEIKISQ